MANVSTIHPSLVSQINLYKFIDDLSDGYDGIKAGGDTYLPKQLSEKNDNRVYNLRHELACYLDSFNPIIDGINGLIFQKPVAIETTNNNIQDFLDYATSQNKNFNFFVKKYFKSALKKGRTYAYVDIPSGNENITTNEQRVQAGIKPFVVLIKPEQIINYRTDVLNGKEQPTMIVIEEVIEVEIDDFEIDYEKQYRVLRIGSVEVYDKNYNLIQQNETGLNKIPIVELNLDEDGFLFHAKPPFLDVGRLSIDNYQLMSDSRWSANTASIPFLALLGFSEDEAKSINISVNSGMRSDNADASVSYVDYEGKGVELNLKLMEVINKRISEIGMSVLTSTSQEVTATEKTIDTIQTQSKLYNWVDSLKDSIYQILELVDMYYNQTSENTVSIEADILDNLLSAEEMAKYSDMVAKGQLSNITLWEILKSKGRLPEDFDSDIEDDRVQSANSPFGSVIE